MTTIIDNPVLDQDKDDLSSDQQQAMEQLRSLCRLMDEAVAIPGTRFRVGLDSLTGLVPVLGDGTSALVSAYIIHRAKKLGARKRTLARMYFNVGMDFVTGLVPILGDLLDVGWKCNMRNLRLLERDLRRATD